ncbi:MAG: hypothetical protein HY661_19800 [Betaproteobacteria bacterium]|nr:hypothetical protein [Betaproteobacteria bacterium]
MMPIVNISTELFAELWKRYEAGEQSEEDILRRLLQLDSHAKSADPAQQPGATAGDPSFPESLTLEGHWCASDSCPKHLLAKQQAGVAEHQPVSSDSPLRVAHWCATTTCPLV